EPEAVFAGRLAAVLRRVLGNQPGGSLRRSRAVGQAVAHAGPRLRSGRRHEASRARRRGPIRDAIEGADAILHDPAHAARGGLDHRARRQPARVLGPEAAPVAAHEQAGRPGRSVAEKGPPVDGPESLLVVAAWHGTLLSFGLEATARWPWPGRVRGLSAVRLAHAGRTIHRVGGPEKRLPTDIPDRREPQVVVDDPGTIRSGRPIHPGRRFKPLPEGSTVWEPEPCSAR